MEICTNTWEITSLYEFLFFNCPSCNYKVVSSKKQSFVNHAYEVHPESIDHLSDIQDGSISDINPPWQDIKPQWVALVLLRELNLKTAF